MAAISSSWPSVYLYQAASYRTIRWPGQTQGQTLPASVDDRVGWTNTPSATRSNTPPNAISASLVTRPWKDIGHPARQYMLFDQFIGVAPFGQNLNALA